MKQQDVMISQLAPMQLAQTVTDLLEHEILYLVVGSRKADIEACKKEGVEVWAIKKELWKELCSRGIPELKEASGDMVIAPSDQEIKQTLVQEIFKLFEENPSLAKEISSFIKDKEAQKMTAENGSLGAIKQNSNDKIGVIEEFNRLLEEFQAKYSDGRGLDQSGTGKGKEELMEKTLDLACQIQYGDLRSYALSRIVPYLEGPRKGEYIKKALYFTSLIQDEDERATVLSSLAPHLKGPGKEELIEEILDFAPNIQYGDAKFQIFFLLIHYFGKPISKNLTGKALGMIEGIQSDYLKVRALSLLISYLNEKRKKEIIEETLQLAFSLKDKNIRFEALQFIIPYLDETRKKEIMKTRY
ncbi:MAG TPA: hypothetical protein HA306_05810 [Methanosarcina sp.]|nr:hypothetical protein [Methanosarcina sp.]